jgi:hypothetical protein
MVTEREWRREKHEKGIRDRKIFGKSNETQLGKELKQETPREHVRKKRSKLENNEKTNSTKPGKEQKRRSNTKQDITIELLFS